MCDLLPLLMVLLAFVPPSSCEQSLRLQLHKQENIICSWQLINGMARESPSRNSLSHELRYGAPCVVHGVGGAKHYRLLVIATLFANMVLSAEPPPRAAGGRGPELRSRVTQEDSATSESRKGFLLFGWGFARGGSLPGVAGDAHGHCPFPTPLLPKVICTRYYKGSGYVCLLCKTAPIRES